MGSNLKKEALQHVFKNAECIKALHKRNMASEQKCYQKFLPQASLQIYRIRTSILRRSWGCLYDNEILKFSTIMNN